MERYCHRVQYYETDQMAITHHANYVRWMEEARVDLLRQIGWDLSKLEQTGIVTPVTELECKFKRATAFEDEVFIDVKIESFNGVRLKLNYRMENGEGLLVCLGHSEHCFTDKEGKLVRVNKTHPEFYAALTALIED